jgi:hypothetical protein
MTREIRKSPSTGPTRLAIAAGAGERHATFGFPNRRPLPAPRADPGHDGPSAAMTKAPSAMRLTEKIQKIKIGSHP